MGRHIRVLKQWDVTRSDLHFLKLTCDTLKITDYRRTWTIKESHKFFDTPLIEGWVFFFPPLESGMTLIVLTDRI